MICAWAGCTDPAAVHVEGREGSEHFTLDLCLRHLAALREQHESWHLEDD